MCDGCGNPNEHHGAAVDVSDLEGRFVIVLVDRASGDSVVLGDCNDMQNVPKRLRAAADTVGKSVLDDVQEQLAEILKSKPS